MWKIITWENCGKFVKKIVWKNIWERIAWEKVWKKLQGKSVENIWKKCEKNFIKNGERMKKQSVGKM
jgi:hypothetical protein